MDDLLQSQIREGCKLALPEGLQELMSDISREVLRSQPENLYQFIANYLEALLSAREALSIACRLCGEVSACCCQPQLDDELRRIGLQHEDVATAKNIILDYFDQGQVQESNLLMKLATKTSMTETQLVDLQKAVQKAFQRHISKTKDLQVSFAKFGEDSSEPTADGSNSSVSTQSRASDFYKPSYSLDTITIPDDTQASQWCSFTSYPQCASVSATTLAGSYVDLPSKIPYSVHNSVNDNILMKSEKSVLNLLKQIIFNEERQLHAPAKRESDTLDSQDVDDSLISLDSQNTDSGEIDDTIKSVLSLNIHEYRSKKSKELQSGEIFKAIQENLNESSSGGS